MRQKRKWQHYLTTRMYPQLSFSFLCLLVGDSFVFLQRLNLKYTEQNNLLLLLQWGYSQSNRSLWPLGLWGDTALLCSWLVSPFYPRLPTPGHRLEHCFSAHTGLSGCDLNTSNNPARTSATAVEDWKLTRFLILETAKMREYIVFKV